MKKQYILILAFLFGKLSFLQAQCYNSPEQNLNKYWEWRERLKNFVVPGTCMGCSMPAKYRSANNTFLYNDSPEKLGWYIGVLATEWYLLRNNTDTASINQCQRDVAELYYAVNEVNTIDIMANASWRNWYNSANSYNTQPGDLDGFIIRDNVPDSFPNEFVNNDYVENYLDKCLNPVNDGYEAKYISSDWTGQGQIGKFDKIQCYKENNKSGGATTLSIDDMSQLYIGIALVSKFIPSSLTYNGQSIQTMSVNEENRIYNLIRNNGDELENTITNECGTGINWSNKPLFLDYCKCNVSGTDISNSVYSIGEDFIICPHHAIQDSFHSFSIAGVPRWWDMYSWIYMGYRTEYMILSMGTIGNAWGSLTPNVVRRMALKQDNPKKNNAGCCDIYPLLCDDLWGELVPDYGWNFYDDLLTAAPCHGIPPNSDNYEWGNGDRIGAGYGPGCCSDVWSGLDYLLFFNLFEIAYPLMNGSGNYVTYQYINPKNLREPYLVITNNTESDERNFWASDSIKAGNGNTDSLYIISNDSDPNQPLFQGRAQVSFRAGHKIDLEPGFEATPGVLFDATIDTTIHTMNCIDCGSSVNIDSLLLPIDTSGNQGAEINYFTSDTIYGYCSQISPIAEPECNTFTEFGINGDTAGIKSWYWNFGNGQTSTAYNPTVTYCPPVNVDTSTGLRDTTYLLTLIVLDDSNHYDTIGAYIYFICLGSGGHTAFKPKSNTNIDSITKPATFNILNNVTANLATIQYYLPQQTTVNITVYSMMGLKMETLMDNVTENSGDYSLPLYVNNLQQGMYFITMQAGDFVQTKKLVVVK
ncbi:MAG: T9SS type A sorting domain-containing protein [Bacteroidia bacterium]